MWPFREQPSWGDDMSDRKEPQTVEQARAALKNAEAALESALEREQMAVEKERQRLGELAHEINTPLNALIGYAHIMAQELMGPVANPVYQEHAEIIYRAAVHLQGLTEGILRGPEEAGVNPEDLAEVDVSYAIEGVIKLFSGMAEERGVELKADIADDFPTLKTDPRRLNQILINLVSNAVKFTPRGGNVSVQAETHADSGAMILVIADNGQGMDEETLRAAMQPHQRSASDSPHGDPGSGLGLNIAARMAKEIRGDLWLASEEGIGTVAAIKMPIAYDRPVSGDADAAVILKGRSVLDFAPYRSIHKTNKKSGA